MAIFTFSNLDQNRGKICAAMVIGISASLATISSGQYPISRPLYICVKHLHIGALSREQVQARCANLAGHAVNAAMAVCE